MRRLSHPDSELLKLERCYLQAFSERNALSESDKKRDRLNNRVVEIEARIRKSSPQTERGLNVKLLITHHAMKEACAHPDDFDALKWAAEVALEACWAADRIYGSRLRALMKAA